MAVKVLCAALAAFGFAVFFNLRGKKLAAAAAGGGVGWFFYEFAVGHGDLAQYLAAGLAMAVYAELMARAQKAPVTVYLAPALIPLVPGGMLYQAMLYALNGRNDLFISTGLHALTIIGALTLGIVSVSSVARLLSVRKLRNPYSHHRAEADSDLYHPDF